MSGVTALAIHNVHRETLENTAMNKQLYEYMTDDINDS